MTQNTQTVQEIERVDNIKKSIGKKIIDVLSNIILVILGIFIVYMLIFMFTGMKTNETPTIFGHQIYIVRSNSMNPTFETGSLLVVKQVNKSSIEVSDIITYKRNSESTATTHRVVDIQNDDGLQFVTRGDANNVDDPMPVSSNDVLGKVVFIIPYIGYLFGFIRTKQGLLVFIIIPALLILMSQLFSFLKEVKKHKKENENKLNIDELQTKVSEILIESNREE